MPSPPLSAWPVVRGMSEAVIPMRRVPWAEADPRVPSTRAEASRTELIKRIRTNPCCWRPVAALRSTKQGVCQGAVTLRLAPSRFRGSKPAQLGALFDQTGERLPLHPLGGGEGRVRRGDAVLDCIGIAAARPTSS